MGGTDVVNRGRKENKRKAKGGSGEEKKLGLLTFQGSVGEKR